MFPVGKDDFTERRKLYFCFAVTVNHFYTNVEFFTCNTLTLKVLTCIGKGGFTVAFNRMFSGDLYSVKRLHTLFPCCELEINR